MICVLLVVGASPAAAQCVLNVNSQIDESSHAVLHDFDDEVVGCSRDFGPSGIVYHPGLDRLLVISDEDSQLATMRTDGSDVKCMEIRDAQGNALGMDDHEGITYADPNDGFVFVGLENGGQDGMAFIRQVDLLSARVVKTWKIAFPGGIRGNKGLEGLTFVRDASHPEGGTFYLGDQTAAKVLGGCEVPIRSGGDASKTYTCSILIDPGFDEASGLDYVTDAEIGGTHGVLLVSSDNNNKIKAYAPEGTSLNWKRRFPTSSEPGQEGLAVDRCYLYVSADDNDNSRKIHRYRLWN